MEIFSVISSEFVYLCVDSPILLFDEYWLPQPLRLDKQINFLRIKIIWVTITRLDSLHKMAKKSFSNFAVLAFVKVLPVLEFNLFETNDLNFIGYSTDSSFQW